MPKGIRPTQNKVRKALFDILGSIAGLSFLELFAGSGAIGFEALSRGVRELALVENDPGCLKLIREAIEGLKPPDCTLYPIGAEKAIGFFHGKGKRFDIVFLDPPYFKGLPKKTLQLLGAYDILAPNGLLAVQHFKKEDLPESAGDLRLLKQYEYGDTLLTFYSHVPAGNIPGKL